MIPISQEGAFDSTVRRLINQNFNSLGITPGTVYYLDPFAGYNGNDGLSPSTAFKTLATAYNALAEGKDDVVVLLSNGLTTSTARIESAFTWSKNAAHMVGVSSGVNISNRSRIAPTGSTTAFANFFTVSGSGCYFSNLQFYQGFDTGTTAAICMTVTGGRNLFNNCHFAGMADTESAQSSTSRSLKVSGTGENMFVNTTIGVDTVASNTTNASLELASATPRNQFIGCIFPRMTSSSGSLFIVGAATGCIDRFTIFKQCLFINAVKSTSTTMTAAVTLAASAGGLFLLKDSTLVGATDWGSDSTTFAQIFIDGAAPTANSSGLAVATA